MELALPLLEPFVIAIGMLILAGVLVYMLKSIAAWLGVFHLPFGISINFGAIFAGIVSPVVSAITYAATHLFHPLAAWLVAADYNVLGVAQDALRVMAHQAAQIAHLHDVTIPKERAAAEAQAARNTAAVAQGIRDEIHLAQRTWEHAHSLADAARYINLERDHPSVEHAELALAARTLIAGGHYADTTQALAQAYADQQLIAANDYTDARIAAWTGTISDALTIPQGAAIPNIDVGDLIDGAAVVTVGTAVAVIAAKIVNCLVSNCKGNNNFGNLLKDALGIADAAALTAFIAAAVNDPAGAVGTYSGVLASTATGVLGASGGAVGELESLFA